MNANHQGNYQFKICAVDDSLPNDPSQSCFDANILKFANGETSKSINAADTKVVNKFSWGTQVISTYNIVLPANLTCTHCMLQVS